jgi:CubicO group peptidase (beta-lactamase class C family)
MMIDRQLDRRTLLRGGLALGAAAWRAPAWARAVEWGPVRDLLDRYVRPQLLPGLAAALARGDDAPDFVAAGTLARDSAVPVGPDTLYRVYSMTKPVTGVAAMLLIEDGRLGLDQNIADFVPGFAAPRVLTDPATSLASRPAAGPITVRHLLTHTAGLGYTIVTKGPLLREYFRLGLTPFAVSRTRLPDLPPFETAPSLAAFADRLATLPLIADPGTRWSYSVSLDLLGRVIEVASGMPFDRFLAERLFDPLGMTSSFFRVPASDLPRLATNYVHLPDGPVPIDGGAQGVFADPPAFPFGGAGLVTSPRDYDRFLRMLAGEGAIGGTRIMAPATARLAMSNLLPAGAETRGTQIAGQGFGAGGRVTLAAVPGGSGPGTFGWGGAAATVAFVDGVRGVRASGYAQFMPDDRYRWTRELIAAVYGAL